jgi:hydrogenase expression/formation protein HypC
MCLSIPAKIISVEGETAKASVGGAIIKVGLQMVDDVKAGDYVLVHTGFALQKISDREAQETLKLIKELDNINKL